MNPPLSRTRIWTFMPAHPCLTDHEGYSECVPGHFRVIGVDVLLKFRFSVVMVG